MGRAGALLAKKLYSCLAGDKERGGCLRGMAAARSRKTHKTGRLQAASKTRNLLLPSQNRYDAESRSSTWYSFNSTPGPNLISNPFSLYIIYRLIFNPVTLLSSRGFSHFCSTQLAKYRRKSKSCFDLEWYIFNFKVSSSRSFFFSEKESIRVV